MKAVIQRVSNAQVEVDGRVVSGIGAGLLTLLGVVHGDSEENVRKLIQKIIELRIFEDEKGKMNRSLVEIRGEHLIVSQFTLAADTTSGRRPSFLGAERPEKAKPLWELALRISQEAGIRTVGGIFQAEMKVTLTNDGPVTLTLES